MEILGGTGAPQAARSAALVAARRARTVVLVEGISDLVAVETLATRRGFDLAAERVVVVPIGGAHAIGAHLRLLGRRPAAPRLLGLCDAAEEPVFRRGLARTGLGTPSSRAELEAAGFLVCVDDLEDELIRAAGEDLAEAVLAANGDLGAFRTLQQQPAWRDQPHAQQLHRFLGAGSRRKGRYARLLLDALPTERVPRPLARLLDLVTTPA